MSKTDGREEVGDLDVVRYLNKPYSSSFTDDETRFNDGAEDRYAAALWKTGEGV